MDVATLGGACAWFPWAPRALFSSHGVAPDIRVETGDREYVVRVHLPDALEAERVGVSVHDQGLHLVADHVELTEDLGGLRQRTRVCFEHSLRLPDLVGAAFAREAHGRELVVRLPRRGDEP